MIKVVDCGGGGVHLIWRKKLSGSKHYNYTVEGKILDPVKVYTYTVFFVDEERDEFALGTILGSADVLYHVNQFRKDINIRMYELEFKLPLQIKIKKGIEKKIEGFTLSDV